MKLQHNVRNLTTVVVASVTSFYSLAAVKADMVIHNAKVYTVDSQDSIAQAIAVKGNKINDISISLDISFKFCN
ncbi:hypothetical protein [Colwellia psychrerythraea]|uniref:Uncharacterized protein n=1 Tax=Colwellia psychrerythraea TaxID=28229 RepID=A0A099KYT0_COLPS|nr:hypothetical protein [Colwellia psychrerythraea]KGJ95904.1 hypothetical protein GAB14E_1816 [Colwellia psychrerythraea]